MPYVNLSHVASYYILFIFWFCKIKYSFLTSPAFKFTGTEFSSPLSTLYILNTSMRCSRPFQSFYNVYFFVACG